MKSRAGTQIFCPPENWITMTKDSEAYGADYESCPLPSKDLWALGVTAMHMLLDPADISALLRPKKALIIPWRKNMKLVSTPEDTKATIDKMDSTHWGADNVVGYVEFKEMVKGLLDYDPQHRRYEVVAPTGLDRISSVTVPCSRLVDTTDVQRSDSDIVVKSDSDSELSVWF